MIRYFNDNEEDLQIYQPKNGYCYNSDTLFLYAFMLPFIKPRQEVLEVGAGSGILSLLCARDREVKLHIIEKNATMMEFCRNNLRINKVCANVISGDFLMYDFLNLRFDRIISNPPFYHSGVIKSAKKTIYEARYEENLPFELMVKKIDSILKPKGEFIFCYDCKSSYKLFYTLIQYNIRPITIRFVYPKIDKEATLILCRAKKDSKSAMQVLPPLFTHNEQGFTKEVQEIYAKANTWSIKC